MLAVLFTACIVMIKPVHAQTVESLNGSFTVHIHAGETITIPDLPAGTKYSVREKDIPSGWNLEGEVNTEGSITPNSTASAVIRNRYSANGSITLLAYKTMPGTTLRGGEFTFELLNADGEILQTALNGTIDNAEQITTEDDRTVPNPYYGMSIVHFETITYDKAGTYHYTIREKAGNDENIQYDVHDEPVFVQVTDMNNGLLSCTATYDTDGPVFTNTKKPQVEEDKFGTLAISKTVTNMETAQEFSFRISLTDANGTALSDSYEAERKTTDGINHEISVSDGSEITLKSGETVTVKNLPVGSVYQVEEVNIPQGYELTNSENTEGVIQENVISTANFSNIYNADGNAVFAVTKILQGGEIQDEQFKFILNDDTGAVLQEVYASTDGSVIFAPIIYTQTDTGKTFHYTIYEEKGTDTGLHYDGHTVDVSVDVTDKGNGMLETAVSYNGETTFTNAVLETEAVIKAKKIYSHGTLEDGLFQFELLNDVGEQIGTASCDANGDVVFAALSYKGSDIGTHTYTVKEITSAENIVWDTHDEIIKVKVEKTTDTEELKATVLYDNDGAVFTNNAFFPHDLSVSKTVSGNMGDKSKDFGFTLTLTGTNVPDELSFTKGTETGTLSLTDGVASFTLAHGESITFHDIAADTKYAVKEDGVFFQGYVVTKENTTGTIKDDDIDVTFNNHKFISVPTSADTNINIMIALVCVAIIMGGAYVYSRKKKA